MERCFKCGKPIAFDIIRADMVHTEDGKSTGVTCAPTNEGRYSKGVLKILRGIHCKQCKMKDICKETRFPVVHRARPQQVSLKVF